jgi:EAL domain-containing protein (putative c-di-GMP-specific phosphodiesterase class I)
VGTGSASDSPRDTDGVRLLSQRPSVLSKLAPHVGEPGDVSGGLRVAGPGWEDRLKDLLAALSPGERAAIFAVRLNDDQALPLPAGTVLTRTRTDWFPEFLSFGRMEAHFQPIVDLETGVPFGREALMRGRLGTVEVRGGELLAAAEAHDALYSFDARARAAAIEGGIPLLPAGEVLFVNMDPRAVVDVPHSIQATWPLLERAGGRPDQLCLEIVGPDRFPDRGALAALTAAHRERGALIALDDLSGGADSLECLEMVRPDIAKLDTAFVNRLEHSAAQRRLVAALVECAHEQGAKVVAEGVERVQQFEAVRELGVEYGQGFYFGQPTARPMAVDPRLVRKRALV